MSNNRTNQIVVGHAGPGDYTRNCNYVTTYVCMIANERVYMYDILIQRAYFVRIDQREIDTIHTKS